MRVPRRLEPLVEQGIVHDVIRPLMSGKEADVYLVETDGETRVAKIYKEAQQRSFKHRADYTEGRRTRNTRRQRAMDKRSKYGREEMEVAWRSAEVDAIYRLRSAGVRVPEPYDFVEGVLVMELVQDADGHPAPRLVDIEPTEKEALKVFDFLLREVVKMLCAGLVHGDLSDFNVLIGVDGPVIIDFPQAVDATSNRNARELLIRDVDNLTSFLGRFAPQLKERNYGKEIWDLFEKGNLEPDTVLTGKYRGPKRKADTRALLREIEAVEREERRKREAQGESRPRTALAQHRLDDEEEREEQPRRNERGPREERSGREEREPRVPREEQPRAEGPSGAPERRGRRLAVEITPEQRPPAKEEGRKKKRRRRKKRGGQQDQTAAPNAERAPDAERSAPRREERAAPRREEKPAPRTRMDELDAMLIVEE